MPAKPVADEPEVTVTRWAFVSHSGIGYRISGIRADGGRGRLSSPVVEYDHAAKTATTESGRVYRLQGKVDHALGMAIAYAYAKAYGIEPDRFESSSIANVVLALEPKPTRGMN